MNKKIQFRGQISPIMSAIRMGGDVMRVSFDVPLTEREHAIGLLGLTDQPLKFSIEVDSSPASTRIERPEQDDEPQLKGPFSRYWQRMFAKGFYTYPSIIETLGCAGQAQIKLRLYDVFQVLTCADISPAEFEKWMESEGPELFASLITLSRRAQAQIQEAA